MQEVLVYSESEIMRKYHSEIFYGQVDNASVFYLEGEKVPEGCNLFIINASIEDSTTAPATIAFGKIIGNRFEAFEEEDSPAAGITYHIDRTYRFKAGEKPCWRFETLALNDIIRGFAEGYYEEL